jgi:hypothetical protein
LVPTGWPLSAVVDFADFVTFGNCYLCIDRIADERASQSSAGARKLGALRLAHQKVGEKNAELRTYMRLVRAAG